MKRLLRSILLATLALAATASSLRGQETSPARLPPVTPPPVTPPPVAAPQFNSAAQFEHGQPHKIIDAVGWVFGIPKKIILCDRRAVNHNVSAETEQNLAEYLDANGLASTKVRINQYDPVGEWRRLRTNTEVGAGWRYTIGAFDTLAYTVIPGRLFGADWYNPYTDSVYIYSDIPCLAEEQASYAKLIRARAHPGTYAVLTSLPVVQLWPEKESKTDVLDYTLTYGTTAQRNEATHVFYAEYGAEVGSQASLLLGSNLPFTLVGAGVGHVAAHYDASDSPASPSPPDAALTATQAPETGTATLKR